MPIMPLSDVRVVDPVLTNLSHGYKNSRAIGLTIAPPVPVTQYGGKTVLFDDSSYIEQDFTRSQSSPYNKISDSYSSTSYELLNKGAEYDIPWERMKDGNLLGFDHGEHAVNKIMAGLVLEHEKEVASLVTNATLYPTANKATLSGTSQWSDPASKPGTAIRSAKNNLLLGGADNESAVIFWMGQEVFSSLQENPDLIDRFKHTSRESITADMMATYFDVDAVVVGAMKSRTVNATTNSFLWGKFAGLCCVHPAALNGGSVAPSGNINMYQPSFAYTYTYNEGGQTHPYMKPMHRNEQLDQDEYRGKYDRCVKLTGIESGYLWSAAVA